MKTVTNPNRWRRRTALQRCLACITVVWLVSGLAEADDADKIGYEAVHSAAVILKKSNLEINPCDDFYQFACGNFLDTTSIPEDKVLVDSFSTVGDKLREQLTGILTEKRPDTDPIHYRLPTAFFMACMNKDVIETLGPKPIQEIAEEVGGWPVIVGDCWNSDDSWNWQQAVKKSRSLGLIADSMLMLSVNIDMKDNTKRLIVLDQPSLGLRLEYLVKGFSDPLVLAYYNYMVDVAVLFGAETETAKRELKESLTFEMKLAHISWPTEKRSNLTEMYNLRSIKQLQVSYPNIDWLDYINAFFPDGLQVKEDEVVNIAMPSYLDGFYKLIKDIDNRIIANHMMWRTYEFAVDHLPEIFRRRKLQFTTALTGKQERSSRLVECVDIVSERFSISVGSQYVQKYFKLESKNVAMKMVTNIKNAFRQLLDKAMWMDNKTKLKAKQKLDSLHTRIGYPDELVNNAILEEYYRGLNISDPDNYLKSSLMLNIFNDDHEFKKLRLPVSRTDWNTFKRPARTSAYYRDTENSITFAAGILQHEFFQVDRLKCLNYGAIGNIIGHEISHAFDDIGCQFDGVGNLANWWENGTKNAYFEKAQCIIDKYSNYTDEQVGLKLNGKKTQSENIADNAGIKAAYLAYTHWLSENGPEPSLPALSKFTSKQLFWIKAAQLWCAKFRDEELKTKIITHLHPPGRYRILGSFSNTEAFSNDFNCALGKPMNPVEKCGVW